VPENLIGKNLTVTIACDAGPFEVTTEKTQFTPTAAR
jgi:hypothetical protein